MLRLSVNKLLLVLHNNNELLAISSASIVYYLASVCVCVSLEQKKNQYQNFIKFTEGMDG